MENIYKTASIHPFFLYYFNFYLYLCPIFPFLSVRERKVNLTWLILVCEKTHVCSDMQTPPRKVIIQMSCCESTGLVCASKKTTSKTKVLLHEWKLFFFNCKIIAQSWHPHNCLALTQSCKHNKCVVSLFREALTQTVWKVPLHKINV